jgi:hypothetical protein
MFSKFWSGRETESNSAQRKYRYDLEPRRLMRMENHPPISSAESPRRDARKAAGPCCKSGATPPIRGFGNARMNHPYKGGVRFVKRFT